MMKTTLVAPSGANRQITVDTARFIQTRDTLTSAYLNLSMSMDRMVKAYLEHTQVVIDGDASLNASLLLAPLQAHNDSTQALQDMLQQSASASMQPALVAVGTTPGAAADDDGAAGKTRKKRAYKRDPNAPKRPLTAYFRYLQENRHKISEELHEHPEKFHVDGKAGDLSKIATERWNALSKEEREPWHEAYRLAMEDWKAQIKAAGGGEPVIIGEGDDAVILHGAVAPHVVDIPLSSDLEVEAAMAAAPPPPKSAKKTPATSRKSTGGAAAAAAATGTTGTPATGAAKRTFSSIPAEPAAAATPKTSSPERKRKAAAEPEESTNKKKRGRKSKADGEPATPAAAGAPAPTPASAVAASAAAAAPAETEPAAKKKSRKEKKDDSTTAAATKKSVAADKKDDRKKKKTS